MKALNALVISELFFASLVSCTNDDIRPNLIPSTDDILCEHHPVFLAGEEITNRDTCQASAKIQAIAYECGYPSDTLNFTQRSLKENIQRAQEHCDNFCKKVSRQCHGYLIAPSDCGLKSPPGKALDFGVKEIHCPKQCKGQAFNYCSLYHASFFQTSDRSLFNGMPNNCECRK